MSLKKTECLVYGFVKENYIQNTNQIYPLSLNVVILQLLGNIWCIFDLTHPNYKHAINEDPTIVQSVAGGCMVANSNGFMSGIMEFRVKVIEPGSDVIGITTNVHECIESADQWFYYKEPDTHFTWYNGSNTIYANIDKLEVHRKSIRDGWEQNDIIKIVVDCELSKISFYKNDETIDANITIKSDTMYYFMMCLNAKCSKYQILW